MLCELRIRNFAIIDELAIEFRSGLNVITGETGAGKSILIQALALLCGGRGNPDVVRGDAEAASIEGLFRLGKRAGLLEDLGLDPADEVLLRRVIARNGKGRIHINGSPATLALLGQLTAQLVHIYGQHEQTLLLQSGAPLDLLDRFGDLEGRRTEMAAAFAALATARERLAELQRARQEREERRQLLEFQAQELGATAPRAGEEAELRAERELLRHAERLQRACGETEATLYSGDGATVDTLARAAAALRELVSIDPALEPPADLIETARVQLEEAAAALRARAERVRVDPQRLEEIEERVALLSRLSRKYGVPSDDLAATAARLRTELEALAGLEADCAAAAAAAGERGAAAVQLARRLSAERRAAAQRLERAMVTELEALGMRGGKFKVAHEVPAEDAAAGALTAAGFDRVEFHLSTNAGEDPKPLARIASGGELSRIMLALKALTASVIDAPVLIFDEVDAGIGGTVADAVARRLHLLGRKRQLLCITHLPQIAAYADHHLAVDKTVTRGRTLARARSLSPADRVAELSRMLGGSVAPSEAERYARRLISEAREPSA